MDDAEVIGALQTEESSGVALRVVQRRLVQAEQLNREERFIAMKPIRITSMIICVLGPAAAGTCARRCRYGSTSRRGTRQVVPHQHHADAPGEADHNEADHVVGLVAQQEHRYCKHEHRSHKPVLDE